MPEIPDVNFIRHKLGFSKRILDDDRLTPYHISLYDALFLCWNEHHFRSPFQIDRWEIMRQAAIGSVNTYRKCLNELNKWGYLRYLPSQNNHISSQIELHRLDVPGIKIIGARGDQAASKPDTRRDRKPVKTDSSAGTSDDRGVSPYNTNNTNNANEEKEKEGEPAPAPDNRDKDLHSPTATEKKDDSGGAARVPKNLDEVIAYFVSLHSTALEAKKFYYHYQSNGWMVGASPMHDWHASVQKWMLQPERGKPIANRPTPGSLQTPGTPGVKKDFNIPL